MKHGHYSEQEAQAIKQQLQREGHISLNRQAEQIHNSRLRKINKKYSIDVAYSKADIPSASRPMVTLPSDILAEPDGKGGWVLAADQGKIS